MSVSRWARVTALVALPLALLLAACGDDDGTVTNGTDDPTISGPATSTTAGGQGQPATTVTTAGSNTATIAVTVRGGSVDGETRRRVRLNQPVSLTVTADVTDEVHVHGYNVTADVTPARPAQVNFVANIPGVFEVELERAHKVLFSLEVQP